ncbi:MAG: hypothetical protein ACI9FD_004805, partial [Gammaproteobacteria bacterium]
ELRVGKSEPVYGVGKDKNIVVASLHAIVSGLNRSGYKADVVDAVDDGVAA